MVSSLIHINMYESILVVHVLSNLDQVEMASYVAFQKYVLHKLDFQMI